MVTACSTSAVQLLSQPALHLRLLQWEALRNKTNREGERTSTCSTKSTTSPSEGRMETNLSKPWDLHHMRTWVPIFTPAHRRSWPTLYLYPGDREGHLRVHSCQQPAGALKCVQLMWRIPFSEGQPMVPWTVLLNYWPSDYLGPNIQM